MTQFVPTTCHTIPALVALAGNQAGIRLLEFFASTLRNPHTRRAYTRAVTEFLAWCEACGVPSIAAVQPLHVAAWTKLKTRERAAPTVKQHLAAVRHLSTGWSWVRSCRSTRPPRCAGRRTACARARRRCSTRPRPGRCSTASTLPPRIGLRDRALIALMVYSFGRIGAALAMRVEDVFVQDRRLWVRLREKGGKRHEMPCHHSLDNYLHAYLDGTGSRLATSASVVNNAPFCRMTRDRTLSPG